MTYTSCTSTKQTEATVFATLVANQNPTLNKYICGTLNISHVHSTDTQWGSKNWDKRSSGFSSALSFMNSLFYKNKCLSLPAFPNSTLHNLRGSCMWNKFLPNKQVTLYGTAHQFKQRAQKYTYNNQCTNSELNVLFIHCCTSRNVDPALGMRLHRLDKVLLLQFHGPNDGAAEMKNTYCCIHSKIQYLPLHAWTVPKNEYIP